MMKSLTAATVLALYAICGMGGAIAQPESNQCLVVKDIASYSQGGRHTIQNGVQSVIVRTYENKLWRVEMQGLCPYNINSHFVYQDWQLGDCLKHGDALQLAGGGACMVGTIQQIPSNLPPGSGRGGPIGF